MFLPASEPVALLQKSHRLPRHLVRGIVPGGFGKRAALATGPDQVQQQAFDTPSEAQTQTG